MKDDGYEFAVGDRVRHVLDKQREDGHHGVVTARETFEDEAIRRFYYVRFAEPTGSVSGEPMRLQAKELRRG